MNRKFLLSALLLVVVACKREESSQNVRRDAVNPPAAQTPYTLQVVFRGLAAFAEKDSGQVLAFLVDADYEKDPRDAQGLPPAESLPPGVLEEIRSGISNFHSYPAHFARIRLQNADVLDGPTPDPKLGLSIDGGELTFKNNLHPEPPGGRPDFAPLTNLAELSDATEIFAARPQLRENALGQQSIAALDELDPQLLNGAGAVAQRLAARVVMGAGRITAGPAYCPGGRKGYSFKIAARPPIGLQCPGESEDAVRLAEEVWVEQNGVTVPTVINLGPAIGKSITIRPLNVDKPVVVEILNHTKEALEGEQCLEERHPEVFRWFYRLASPEAQLDTANHLFPCEKIGTAGDPKCPLKEVSLPGGGG
jgi:hypothetical protein